MKAKTKVFDYSTYNFIDTAAADAAYKIDFSRRGKSVTFAEKMDAPLAELLEKFRAFCAENADIIDDNARDMMEGEIKSYKAEFEQAYN